MRAHRAGPAHEHGEEETVKHHPTAPRHRGLNFGVPITILFLDAYAAITDPMTPGFPSLVSICPSVTRTRYRVCGGGRAVWDAPSNMHVSVLTLRPCGDVCDSIHPFIYGPS